MSVPADEETVTLVTDGPVMSASSSCTVTLAELGVPTV